MSRNNGITRTRYLESKLDKQLKCFGYTFLTDKAGIRSVASDTGDAELLSSSMLLVLSYAEAVKPLKSKPARSADLGYAFSYAGLNAAIGAFNSKVSSLVDRLNYLFIAEDTAGLGQQPASFKDVTVLQSENGNIKLGAVISFRSDTDFTGIDSNISLDRYRGINNALIIKTDWGRTWEIKHGLNAPINELKIIVESDEPMTEPYPSKHDPLNVIHVDSVAMDCASGGVAFKRLNHFNGDEIDMRALLSDAIKTRDKKVQAENDKRDKEKQKKLEAERRKSGAALAELFRTKVPKQ
jgi:hypothetical protein